MLNRRHTIRLQSGWFNKSFPWQQSCRRRLCTNGSWHSRWWLCRYGPWTTQKRYDNLIIIVFVQELSEVEYALQAIPSPPPPLNAVDNLRWEGGIGRCSLFLIRKHLELYEKHYWTEISISYFCYYLCRKNVTPYLTISLDFLLFVCLKADYWSFLQIKTTLCNT